jgi:hypothetical protein
VNKLCGQFLTADKWCSFSLVVEWGLTVPQRNEEVLQEA